jgi:hypothetical protein
MKAGPFLDDRKGVGQHSEARQFQNCSQQIPHNQEQHYPQQGSEKRCFKKRWFRLIRHTDASSASYKNAGTRMGCMSMRIPGSDNSVMAHAKPSSDGTAMV